MRYVMGDSAWTLRAALRVGPHPTRAPLGRGTHAVLGPRSGSVAVRYLGAETCRRLRDTQVGITCCADHGARRCEMDKLQPIERAPQIRNVPLSSARVKNETAGETPRTGLGQLGASVDSEWVDPELEWVDSESEGPLGARVAGSDFRPTPHDAHGCVAARLDERCRQPVPLGFPAACR